jgi:hypothetical protein
MRYLEVIAKPRFCRFSGYFEPIFDAIAYLLCFFSVTLCLAGCQWSDQASEPKGDEMIEFRLQPGQYAVIVIMNDTMTLKEARKTAWRRSAEVAVKEGYRYFLVQSETTMRVMKHQAMLDAKQQEIYIEGEFTKTASSIDRVVFPALKVVFQCYEKKPKGKSIKACRLTDCSKGPSGGSSGL